MARPLGPVASTPTVPQKRVRSLPPLDPWWGEDESQNGAGAITKEPVQDRTSDIGAVDSKPWIPIAYGRVRLVLGEIYVLPGDVSTLLYLGSVCEGEIDSIEKVWLNGRLLPGTGSVGDLATNRWYFDTYTGDGTNYSTYWTTIAAGGLLPFDIAGLKTCAHVQLFLYGATGSNSGWPGLWGNGSADMPLTFAVEGKFKKCYDPRGGGSTAWTQNPILQVRDLISNFRKTPSGQIDDVSFAAAATAADAAGYTSDIAISSPEDIDEAIAQILATCNGELTNVGGKTGVMLDQAQAGAAVFTFDEDKSEVLDPLTEYLSPSQRATRVIVKFPNAASNFQMDATPPIEDPGIALGTVELNEKVITVLGATTQAAAGKIALQYYKTSAILERNRFTVGWAGVLLSRYDKIRLKTRSGVDDDQLVLEVNELDIGLFGIVTRPYDGGVYTGTPPGASDPGDPDAGPVNPLAPPDEIAFPTLTPDPPSIYWRPPRLMDAGHAPSALYVDGLTPFYLTLDLGAGNAAKCGKFISSTRDSTGTLVAPPSGVEWSDNGSSWTAVSGFVATSWRKMSSPTSILFIASEWTTPAAAHRYWRANFGTGYLGAYGPGLYDSFVGVLAEVDPEVDYYEIQNNSGNFLLGSPDTYPVFAIIPAAACPTSSKPYDLTAMAAVYPSIGLSTVRPYVRVVRKRGGPSPNGVLLISDAAVSPLTGFAAVEGSLPALSAAGAVVLAMDSADHALKASVNGAAFAPLGGGSGPTLTKLRNGSGITGTINDSNTTFTTSVNASAATAGFFVVVDGVIDLAATWSGTTLTPSSAPHSGIAVLYWS